MMSLRLSLQFTFHSEAELYAAEHEQKQASGVTSKIEFSEHNQSRLCETHRVTGELTLGWG
jgi:hypothetical protein